MTTSDTLPLQRNFLAKSLLAGLALAAGLAMSHPAKASVFVSVRFAPPPLLMYEQPMIPASGYMWVPGYWAWDDDIGDYYWVSGQWVLPPFAGALWTPGYWAWDNGAYFFRRGYWGPVVGYYGGINYGFGYFGIDYVGGYWQRGVFNYNRGYNHIDNRVTNVYNNTTIINKTVINNNRISYNGGPGGVAAQPNMQQRQAERQRHWDAVPAQREIVREARTDTTARFSYNHGESDRMQWRGVRPTTPAANPPQHTAMQPPPESRNMPARPAQGNMMPTEGVTEPRPPRQSRMAHAPGQPQWQEPRERMPQGERMPQPEQGYQEHRVSVRPPMPNMPPQQPRMPPQSRMEQPRMMHAPPASHPAPQQEPRGGNPHRDDRRRERQQID